MPEDTAPQSKRSAPARAATDAPVDENVGQVVRYHLADKFLHVEHDEDEFGNDVENVVEHRHFNAVLCSIESDGTATLKVLPHAHGHKHLARQLNKGVAERNAKARAADKEAALEPDFAAQHIHKISGVTRGTGPGQWSPEGSAS